MVLLPIQEEAELHHLHETETEVQQLSSNSSLPPSTWYYNNFGQLRGYLGLSSLVTQKPLERGGISSSHRNIVLLTWGEDAEARFWPRLGLEIHPTAMPNTIEFFDVQSAWKESEYGTPGGAASRHSTLAHAISLLGWSETEVEAMSLHNAGNDAYWTMRVFLITMLRYLRDNDLPTSTCANSGKWGADPVFVCADFEGWALDGKTNDPGRWQEAGFSILDTRDLKNGDIDEAQKHIVTYHLVNSLYDQQLKNAGGFDNAVKACFREECRPYEFKHGASLKVHQDITPRIVNSFFRVPDGDDARDLIEQRISKLVQCPSNRDATLEEAETLMGKGFGLGSRAAPFPITTLPPALPTPLIEDICPPLAWRLLPPALRRVPNFDDYIYTDVNKNGITEGLLYFDSNRKLTSKTKWIKAMIKKPEANGRFTKQITEEVDAVLKRIARIPAVPSAEESLTHGSHASHCSSCSATSSAGPEQLSLEQVEQLGSKRRPGERVRFSGKQKMHYVMNVPPTPEKLGVVAVAKRNIVHMFGFCCIRHL